MSISLAASERTFSRSNRRRAPASPDSDLVGRDFRTSGWSPTQAAPHPGSLGSLPLLLAKGPVQAPAGATVSFKG